MKTNIHFLLYFTHFYLEWEMFRVKFVEKIKTHILCSVTFFLVKGQYLVKNTTDIRIDVIFYD